MSRQAINDAVKQAASDHASVPTEQEAQQDANVPNEFKGALTKARNRMKVAAKNHILGGITDAIEELRQGNLGSCSDDLVLEIEAFTEDVAVPKLESKASSPSTLFVLPGTTHNG